MKTIELLLVGVALGLVLTCAGTWGATAEDLTPYIGWNHPVVTEGFAVTVGRPEVPPERGSGSVLRVSLRNMTGEPLEYVISSPAVTWRAVVRDLQGNLVKSRNAGYAVVSAWMYAMGPLGPGEEAVDMYDLHLARLSLPPGQYVVRMQREVARVDGEGMGAVESAPFLMTVDEQMQILSFEPAAVEATAATPDRTGPRAVIAVRPVLERHGFTVQWAGAPGCVTAKKGAVVATFVPGKAAVLLGGQEVPMTRPASIAAGRLQAPGQMVSRLVMMAETKPVAQAGKG